MVINAIEEKQRNFTKREVEAAKGAGRLYVIMGRPGRKSFETIVRNGILMNNPIMVQDYNNNVLRNYGEDLGMLKRKTLHQKQSHAKIEADVMPKANQVYVVLAMTYYI